LSYSSYGTTYRRGIASRGDQNDQTEAHIEDIYFLACFVIVGFSSDR
jgi:hypothetical protein